MTARIRFLALSVLVAGCSAPLRTAAPSGPATPAAPPQVAATDSALLVFLDGQEIRAADVQLIDSAAIATIDVLKGPTAISRHGARAAGGVVQIATKAAPGRATAPSPLFLLDGREIPAELVRVLDKTRINSVEVLKGPSALAYGTRAHAGVVLISSKDG